MCGRILKVCRHDVLQTARGSFAKLTTLVQLTTEMNRVDLEVKRSEVSQVREAHGISCKPLVGISPNLQFSATADKHLLIRFLRSKGQRSRS